MALKISSALNNKSYAATKDGDYAPTPTTIPTTSNAAASPTTSPTFTSTIKKLAVAPAAETEATETESSSTSPMTFQQYLADAESARQHAITNAENSYRNALSNYGANAEALSKMGLQGSGYSKYLDRQAYAQKQADINAANNSYMNYLKGVDESRTSAYNSLYNSIDTLSIGDIDRLAQQNNLTPEQISSLKAAKQDRTYKEISQSNYTASELEGLKSELSEDQYNELKNNVYNPSDNITATSAFRGVTATDAYSKLSEILENPDVSKETKDAWQKAYNEAYTPLTHEGVVFNQDGGLIERPGTEGNNITIKGQGDKGDGEFRVQYNGEKGDEDVKIVARDLPAGTVFMYQGLVYVKYSNGECYGIEARTNSYKTHFNELVSKLKGGTTKKA